MIQKRILVVDDSRTTRDQVTQLLREAGFEVVACANGEEGLKAALRVKPDLVVSDVQMPIVDGFGLCEGIKANKATAEVPVLLLTRLEDPTAILRGLQVGADGFLLKSGGLRHLVPQVQRALKDDAKASGRRAHDVGSFSQALRLTEGRRDLFRVLFESMTREAPFDLLALLVLEAPTTPRLVTVSRAKPSSALLRGVVDQMLKTASLLVGSELKLPARDIEIVELDAKLPMLEAQGSIEEAIKVPIWDEGRFAGGIGVFDLSGQLQLEENIRYFFDLGIEFARALRTLPKAT